MSSCPNHKERPVQSLGLCAQCYYQIHAKPRRQTPEGKAAAKAAQARYRSSHKEKLSAYKRTPEQKAKQAKQQRDRREANPDHYRTEGRRYDAKRRSLHRNADARAKWPETYARDREKILAFQREYYQENQEKVKTRAKAYSKSHPEVGQAARARRRARLKALPATLTGEQWKAIKAAYGYRCAYCGCKPKKLTQDHVIPITRNGGTTPDNIVPACQSCNSSKRNKIIPNPPPKRLLL